MPILFTHSLTASRTKSGTHINNRTCRLASSCPVATKSNTRKIEVYGCLAANKLRLIPHLLQLGGHLVTVISLDLNSALFHRAAAAAFLFQFFAQRLQILRRQGQLHDHRHRLALTPLLLAADGGCLFLRRQALRFGAAAGIAAAARAALGRG